MDVGDIGRFLIRIIFGLGITVVFGITTIGVFYFYIIGLWTEPEIKDEDESESFLKRSAANSTMALLFGVPLTLFMGSITWWWIAVWLESNLDVDPLYPMEVLTQLFS